MGTPSKKLVKLRVLFIIFLFDIIILLNIICIVLYNLDFMVSNIQFYEKKRIKNILAYLCYDVCKKKINLFFNLSQSTQFSCALLVRQLQKFNIYKCMQVCIFICMVFRYNDTSTSTSTTSTICSLVVQKRIFSTT